MKAVTVMHQVAQQQNKVIGVVVSSAVAVYRRSADSRDRFDMCATTAASNKHSSVHSRIDVSKCI
jgi:hypothetical protein